MLARAWGKRPRRGDLLAVASFAVLALWVTSGLWRHPDSGIAQNQPDQAFFEWVLAHGARIFTHSETVLRSSTQGFPDGVNLMANTSILGISIPLSPVTILLGARTAFDLTLCLGLFASATSWYLVLSRPLRMRRTAAWIGGLLAGFSPAIVAQANAHSNLVSQALVPVLVWRVVALGRTRRPVRDGLILAVVAIWQVFVSSEILLLTAVATAITVAVVAIAEPSTRARWRGFTIGLLTAAAVAALVLAYPLWQQFRGEGAYRQLPDGYLTMGADLRSFFAFSRLSLAGTSGRASYLASNPTEENTFLGLPLLVLLVVAAIVLWRRPVARGLAIAALVCAVFSLGPHLIWNGSQSQTPMPWLVMQHVPVLGYVVPTRWGLAVFGLAGMLVAYLVESAANWTRGRRMILLAGLALAVVPLCPKPLPVSTMADPPQYLSTEGEWRQAVAGGRSLFFLPAASSSAPDPIRWSAESSTPMPLSQGYFLTAGSDGTAISTAPPRTLGRWLGEVQAGDGGRLTQTLRRSALADLAYWRVGAVVVLDDHTAGTRRLRAAMTRLLGSAPTPSQGVEIWKLS